MQQSNGKIKYALSLIAYIVLAITDKVLTYTATPDLTFEANPLVAVFELGWTSMIIASTIGFVVFAFFLYFTFIKYKRRIIHSNNFKEFIGRFLYDSPLDKFRIYWLFFKIPKDKIVLLAQIGYVILLAVIVLRLILITEWSIIIGFNLAPWMGFDGNWGHWYHTIKTSVLFSPFNGRIDMFVAVIIGIVAPNYWLFKEYRINKAIQVSHKQG